MDATKLKRCFAKEWLIILTLSLLTIPITGIIYGIQVGIQKSKEYKVTQRAEASSKKLDVEWEKRVAQLEQAFDPEAYLKKYGRPATDRKYIKNLLLEKNKGKFSNEQQTQLDALRSQALWETFSEEELKALAEEIIFDRKDLLPSIEAIDASQDFDKVSTTDLFYLRENLKEYISELQSEKSSKTMDYMPMLFISFLFVMPAWLVTIFIRITIWSMRIMKTSNSS